MRTLKSLPGQHIADAYAEAANLAREMGESVSFDFNGTKVVAQPGESGETLQQRWDAEAAAEAYRNSDEYKQFEARRAEEYRQKCATSMRETANTEAEMREAEVPWPYTEVQLADYIHSLVERSHDYGTCCYAMSMAAVAAFQYVGYKLGTTVFQASCADLDIIRRTRSLKGPFMILDAENALYAQSDLRVKVDEALEQWRPWLMEQEKQRLNEIDRAHPDVIAHWKKLAEGGAA